MTSHQNKSLLALHTFNVVIFCDFWKKLLLSQLFIQTRWNVIVLIRLWSIWKFDEYFNSAQVPSWIPEMAIQSGYLPGLFSWIWSTNLSFSVINRLTISDRTPLPKSGRSSPLRDDWTFSVFVWSISFYWCGLVPCTHALIMNPADYAPYQKFTKVIGEINISSPCRIEYLKKHRCMPTLIIPRRLRTIGLYQVGISSSEVRVVFIR